MQVQVRSPGASTSRVREFEHKVRSVLARFETRVRGVRLRVRDVNGPRGGMDKEAIVEARLKGRGPVLAGETGARRRAAVDGALRRLAFALSRGEDRRRSRQRSSRRRRADRRPSQPAAR